MVEEDSPAATPSEGALPLLRPSWVRCFLVSLFVAVIVMTQSRSMAIVSAGSMYELFALVFLIAMFGSALHERLVTLYKP